MNVDLIQTLLAQDQRLHRLETQEKVPIVARYTLDTASILDNTVTVINYDTLIYDPWGAVATGASWAFTAPIGGYYLINAILSFEASTTWAALEIAYLQIYKNAAIYNNLDYQNNNVSGGNAIVVSLQGSDIVHLARTDTLKIRVYQNSGGTRAAYNSHALNYVSIAKVG